MSGAPVEESQDKKIDVPKIYGVERLFAIHVQTIYIMERTVEWQMESARWNGEKENRKIVLSVTYFDWSKFSAEIAWSESKRVSQQL